MRKRFLFLLFLILNINLTFAYIDPGTGGYLLSSLWTALVGFLAIIFGFILRFFRHTVKAFIVKHKVISALIGILVVSSISYFTYSYFFTGESLSLPAYDASLNGVQNYNKQLSYEGYNLYNGKLLDMQGNIIKKWNYSYLSILDKEGNYYAQKGYETLEWGKFDFNDNPIWVKELPIHHEIYLTPNNTIITFTKETHDYNGRLVEFDVILEFDKDGNELQRWSTYDNLDMLKQFHRPLELDNPITSAIPEDHRKNTSIWGANYDYYHLNSFSLVPENSKEGIHKAFTPGNWIISFRHGSMVFILDKDTKEVLWSGIYDQIKDNLEGQHAAMMLGNGNLLIFDNGRYRGWSRIVQINPVTMDVESEYKNEDFFTYSQGYIQLLPNNNLLVTESEKGHVFELTTKGEIVWEYYEPESVENEEYGLIREEIYRMTRYDKNFIDGLLNK